MKESDLNRLSRWAIPGWITFLAFLVFVLLDVVFTPGCNLGNPCPLLKGVTDAYTGIVGQGGNAQWLAAIFVVAAGIPLGFMVYQAYFYLRWNSPASRDGLAGMMVGRLTDLNRITEDIDEGGLWEGAEWKKKLHENPSYKTDHKYRWRLIELVFTEAAQTIDTRSPGVSFYQRHRYLHEIIHTIGGCIGAVYIAFLAYVFYTAALKDEATLIYLTGTIIACAVLFFLLDREWKAAEGPDKLSVRKNIRFFYRPESFIYVILVIHFVFNPFYDPDISSLTAFFIRILPIPVIYFLWRTTQGGVQGSKKNDAITLLFIPLILVGFLYFTLRQSVTELDWGYITSSTMFLVGNLILFKNRQNASDDMLALENYVIKLYLGLSDRTPPILARESSPVDSSSESKT